jgi:hypothetical protein
MSGAASASLADALDRHRSESAQYPRVTDFLLERLGKISQGTTARAFTRSEVDLLLVSNYGGTGGAAFDILESLGFSCFPDGSWAAKRGVDVQHLNRAVSELASIKLKVTSPSRQRK